MLISRATPGSGLVLGREVMPEPRRQVGLVEASGSDIQDQLLLLVGGRANFKAIEYGENFQRGVPHAFVATNEGMISNQREAKGCGCLKDPRRQVVSTERRLGL